MSGGSSREGDDDFKEYSVIQMLRRNIDAAMQKGITLADLKAEVDRRFQEHEERLHQEKEKRRAQYLELHKEFGRKRKARNG